MASPDMHDLSCVVHVHSTHSDGTGTVPEIMAAANRVGADAVLLTDHDSLGAIRAGEEGWWDSSLLLAGHEVTPTQRNHFLAFGFDEEIDHEGLSPRQIVEEVRRRGGFGFAAHPFSEGSERFPKLSSLGVSMAWDDPDCLDGVELWSFLADNAQALPSVRDAIRFIAGPERYVCHPPVENMLRWDEMTKQRRVTAIGGLDAHQFGIRIGGRVLRAMGYRRTFRQLRTHILCEQAMTGDLARDRESVFDALRGGRCYIAANAVAPARGFRFTARRFRSERLHMGDQAPPGGWTLRAETPLPARIVILRDGEPVAAADATDIEHRPEEPGAYRVEAYLTSHGIERTWILSNPIYLR